MIRDVFDFVGVVRQERSGAYVLRLQHRVGKIEIRREPVALEGQAEVRPPPPALAIIQRRGYDAPRQLREVELIVTDLVETIDADVDALDQPLPYADFCTVSSATWSNGGTLK
jgi:hypothetical protein